MHFLSFYEKKQHGTPEFPAEYHYLDLNHPRYNMPFHWHKEWEIIYVRQGNFPVYADGVLYTAAPGEVLLIRDGMLHGGTPADCIYECFLFDLHGLFRNQELVKKYLRPIYRMQLLPKIRYTEADAPEILAVIRDLLLPYQQQNQPETTDLHELITYSCLSRLFTVILRDGYYTASEADSLPQSRKTDQIKSVLEYIETNFAAPITLETLAAEAGMNPRYFCRYFHSITHQTPMDYVNSYRIEQASHLLHDTDLPVTDIGLECGYNDSSYFVKVFRKYRGLTPSRYRKLYR